MNTSMADTPGQEGQSILVRQEGVSLLQRSLLAPTPLDEKLQNITAAIVRLFDADFCRIWLIRRCDRCEQDCLHAGGREGPHACRDRDRCLHLLASAGRYTHLDGPGQGAPFTLELPLPGTGGLP